MQQDALIRRLGGGAVATALIALAGAVAAASALAADPPLATTEPASAIGGTGATLGGKVNPNGAAVATCRFEYGTTANFGAVAPCSPSSLGSGAFNVAVTASISSLEPGTTYHFRLVAASSNGATNGIDRTFTTTGSPTCPNADRRAEQGIAAVQLPDCMALEQVSPSVKFSQRAASPIISVDGQRVGFLSLAALADTPGNVRAVSGDYYIAERDDDGWESMPTSPPFPLSEGWNGPLPRSFDPTLSGWFVLASTALQERLGVARLYRGGLGGGFDPFSPLLVPLSGGLPGNVGPASLHGASRDHSRAFLAMGLPAARYSTSDPAVTGASADRNIYVAALGPDQQPSVSLLARDRDGKNWGGNCGARLGGVAGNGVAWRNQGAISADGSYVLLSARTAQPVSGACVEANKLRILERNESPAGVEISELVESECDREALEPPCATVDGDDLFQGASVDQSKVYFITNRQLADSDLDGDGFSSGCVGFLVGGCDLYLYDAEKLEDERLTQVSAGEVAPGHPTVGSGAGVSGAVAISGDGSRVFFAATGVLTPDPNPEGKVASEFPAGDPKLYVWDIESGKTLFVGRLPAGDAAQLWSGAGTFLNNAYPVPVTATDDSGVEVGGDGRVLFFITSGQLTTADADGTRLDAYRFDSEADPPTLECISCRPGAPDAGPFDVFVRGSSPSGTGTAFAEAGRWVSEDGQSALVRTSQPLVAADLNDRRDDYLWRSGALQLIPGTSFPPGVSSVEQLPPVLSHDGKQIAFTAFAPLLPSDGDTAPDIYVARSGGGFPSPPPGEFCLGELGCRPSSTAQPGSEDPASEATSSRGNVKPIGKPKVKRPAGKKGTVKCPKGKRKVMRKGKARCVKKSSANQRRAQHNQGGQK